MGRKCGKDTDKQTAFLSAVEIENERIFEGLRRLSHDLEQESD